MVFFVTFSVSQDILKSESIKLDWSFKYSLLLDIVKVYSPHNIRSFTLIHPLLLWKWRERTCHELLFVLE